MALGIYQQERSIPHYRELLRRSLQPSWMDVKERKRLAAAALEVSFCAIGSADLMQTSSTATP